MRNSVVGVDLDDLFDIVEHGDLCRIEKYHLTRETLLKDGFVTIDYSDVKGVLISITASSGFKLTMHELDIFLSDVRALNDAPVVICGYREDEQTIGIEVEIVRVYCET